MRWPHANDLAGIFYTGGTTGRSKGVMLSHANLVGNALQMLSEGLFPSRHRSISMRRRCSISPMAPQCIRSLLGGGSNVIVRMFTPELVMAAIEKEQVTDTLLVPTMIQMLVDHPAIQHRRLVVAEADHVRRLADQRSAAEPRYGRSCPDRFSLRLYGMTELSPLATRLPWDQHIGEGREKQPPAARLRPRHDRLRGPDRRRRPQAGAAQAWSAKSRCAARTS